MTHLDGAIFLFSAKRMAYLSLSLSKYGRKDFLVDVVDELVEGF